MNNYIKRMLARPGRYCVSNIPMLMRGAIFFVEVDPDGSCHQLQPQTGQRDGELLPDGWSGGEVVLDLRTLDAEDIPPGVLPC
jgi:hypothetical protein